MKTKILTTIAIILMFTIFSCEKDDSTNYPSIAGSWIETTMSKEQNVIITTDVIWKFNNNNATQILEIKFNGNTVSYKTLSYQYEYNGNHIIFSNSKTKFTYEISVTGNKMRLGNAQSGYFNLTKMYN